MPMPAICPKRCFAVRGSNRSRRHQPEPRRQQRAGAGDVEVDGDGRREPAPSDRSSHSTRNSTPLAANVAGTSVAGDRRRAARVLSATSRMEKTDVAMSIVGSAV